MPTLRTLKPQQYAAVSNEAIDTLPTLEAVGYLAHLLRHEEGYVPTLESLTSRPGISERTASKCRRTLIEYRYYVAVKFQHDDGGLFHTEIWRAHEPFTEADLETIKHYYAYDSVVQIPESGQRDAKGAVVTKPVHVRWAQLESWRGKEVFTRAPGRAPKPGSGTGETRVSAGRTESAASEGSDHRGVGKRGVNKKTIGEVGTTIGLASRPKRDGAPRATDKRAEEQQRLLASMGARVSKAFQVEFQPQTPTLSPRSLCTHAKYANTLLDAGWQPEALVLILAVAEPADGVRNLGGFITGRLKDLVNEESVSVIRRAWPDLERPPTPGEVAELLEAELGVEVDLDQIRETLELV